MEKLPEDPAQGNALVALDGEAPRLSLEQAAKAAKRSKVTLLNAIRAGTLNAPKDGKGRYRIDPAELFRAYPPAGEKPAAPPPRRKTTTPQLRVVAGLDAVSHPLEKVRRDLTWCPRAFVLATLPHKDPGRVECFQRRNGNISITLQPGIDTDTGRSLGFPYGSIPRLVLFWLTTEAIKRKSPRIPLDNSLSDFMRRLGYNPEAGGKKSAAYYVKNQMRRLFASRITIVEKHDFGMGRIRENRADDIIVKKSSIFWTHTAEQPTLFENWVELSPDLYKAMISNPIPAKVSVLRLLKKSPLALDLYALLTREAARVQTSQKPRFIPWSALMEQLGCEYAESRNFAQKARAALLKIVQAYPGLHLGDLTGGIRLFPDSIPDIGTFEAERALNKHAG